MTEFAALILCGGRGIRLESVAGKKHKAMVEISGRPIIWYPVEALRRAGVREIYFTLGYEGDQILRFFGDGKRWGFQARYLKARECVTHSLEALRSSVDKPLFMIHGNILFPSYIIPDLISEYKKDPSALCITALSPLDLVRTHPHVATQGNSITQIAVYDNAPGLNLCWMGIQIFHPRIFDHLSKLRGHGVPEEVFESLPEKRMHVRGLAFESPWFHLQEPSDYLASKKLDVKSIFLGDRNRTVGHARLSGLEPLDRAVGNNLFHYPRQDSTLSFNKGQDILALPQPLNRIGGYIHEENWANRRHT